MNLKQSKFNENWLIKTILKFEIFFFFNREKEKDLAREVELCTLGTQLNAYLYQLCIKLNCCVNLFTLNELNTSSINKRCVREDCVCCTEIKSIYKIQPTN